MVNVENLGQVRGAQEVFVPSVGLLSEGDEVLNLHKRFVSSEGTKHPYFEFAGTGEQLFCKYSRKGLKVEIGRVGAFSPEKIAVFLQAATQAYVSEGTMGDFPENDPVAQQELLAIFSSDFTENHTPVIVSKSLPDGKEAVVGGCMINVGESGEEISSLIGDESASIPTLKALSFKIPQDQASLGLMSENQAFCVTRLLRIPEQLCTKYGISNGEVARVVYESLSGIHTARASLEEMHGVNLDLGLADISDPRLLRLVNSFGWELVTDDVKPTEAVLDTVLRHHYRYHVENGNIFVISASANDLKTHHQIHEKRLGIPDAAQINLNALERSPRRQREGFVEQLNMFDVQPRRFQIGDSMDHGRYREFIDKNEFTLVDTRIRDLVALYQRFHPVDTLFNPDRPHLSLNFRNWLRSEGITSRSFHKEGERLAIPLDYSASNKALWEIMAVLPEELQRQLRESSAWKMMDSPDGKLETRKTLYEDVDLVVIGASVGSVIASTLISALGVNNITLVDPDIQDGTGDARVDNPGLSNHGKLKIVKLIHGLLKAAPHLNYRLFPDRATEENIEEILRGVMPDNPDRRLVIVEEVDDTGAKDLIRKTTKAMYPESDSVLTISIADTGRASAKAIFETPKDAPYSGASSEYTGDPYGSEVSGWEHSDNPQAAGLARLAKILATYGLISPLSRQEDSASLENFRVPLELVNAFNRLLSGEISSFEQSGLASRLSGVVAGSALLSWLEGHLKTGQLNLDLSRLIDSRWEDPEFLRLYKERVVELQEKLKINP